MSNGNLSSRAYRLIGFKAFYDTDADILDWWEAIPSGERSVVLRQVIRFFLERKNDTQEQLQQVSADTAWLRDALTAMPAYLEQMFAKVHMMPVITPTAEERAPEKLSTDLLAERQQRIRKTRW